MHVNISANMYNKPETMCVLWIGYRRAFRIVWVLCRLLQNVGLGNAEILRCVLFLKRMLTLPCINSRMFFFITTNILLQYSKVIIIYGNKVNALSSLTMINYSVKLYSQRHFSGQTINDTTLVNYNVRLWTIYILEFKVL